MMLLLFLWTAMSLVNCLAMFLLEDDEFKVTIGDMAFCIMCAPIVFFCLLVGCVVKICCWRI